MSNVQFPLNQSPKLKRSVMEWTEARKTTKKFEGMKYILLMLVGGIMYRNGEGYTRALTPMTTAMHERGIEVKLPYFANILL